MSPDVHDRHTRRLLDKVAETNAISQRALSRELGIALGLTNLLVRKTVRKGWVRLVRLQRNRVMYLITPAGLAEKARMSRDYFAETVQFYTQTRDRIRSTFAAVSAEWNGASAEGGSKQVVFYGAGEIAEIGFVCLQDCDLSLVAVVDDLRGRPFFGLPVERPGALRGSTVNGRSFGRVIVMSFADIDVIQSVLEARGVPPDRIVWL